MIQAVQNWIWNIGGFLFTIIFILLILAWMSSWIMNRLSWWFKKESRKDLFYWIKNKKRLSEIIEKEKSKVN